MEKRLRKDMVVIGASAGGIAALQELVSQLTEDLAATVIVVQHLSADSPGILPALLTRAGPLPAGFARNEEMPQHGRVYVANPDQHLLIGPAGQLILSQGPKENRSRPAIDVLFRTAALIRGPRVIGVILTGQLNDGSAGLRAIELCGGTCLVQDPEGAHASSMPMSALRFVRARIFPLASIGLAISDLAGSIAQPPKSPSNELIRTLQMEAAVASGSYDTSANVRSLGTPTDLTCPYCHGVLFRMPDPILRFRCHTGHALTAETLVEEMKDASEQALWNAMRSLQEEAILLEHLTNAGEGGAPERSMAQLSGAKAAADEIRLLQEKRLRSRHAENQQETL